MKPETIAQRLQERPFVPFKLLLLDGEQREIPKPERMWVFSSYVLLGYPDPVLPWPAIDRYEKIALANIQALEQAAGSAS